MSLKPKKLNFETTIPDSSYPTQANVFSDTSRPSTVQTFAAKNFSTARPDTVGILDQNNFNDYIDNRIIEEKGECEQSRLFYEPYAKKSQEEIRVKTSHFNKRGSAK